MERGAALPTPAPVCAQARSASWLHAPAHGAGNLRAERAASPRTRLQRKAAEPEHRPAMRFPRGAGLAIGERAFELAAQPFDQSVALRRVKTLQRNTVDDQTDAAHTHPRVSASAIGRSFFSASRCAAWRM